MDALENGEEGDTGLDLKRHASCLMGVAMNMRLGTAWGKVRLYIPGGLSKKKRM
jgi:hypothetical protein